MPPRVCISRARTRNQTLWNGMWCLKQHLNHCTKCLPLKTYFKSQFSKIIAYKKINSLNRDCQILKSIRIENGQNCTTCRQLFLFWYLHVCFSMFHYLTTLVFKKMKSRKQCLLAGLLPRCPQQAATGPGQSQELNLRLLCGWQKFKYLNHHYYYLAPASAGSWSQELELGIKPRYSNMECEHPNMS